MRYLPLLLLLGACNFEKVEVSSEDCEPKNFGFEVHWDEIETLMESHTFVVSSHPDLSASYTLCVLDNDFPNSEHGFNLFCDDEFVTEVFADIAEKWYRGIVTPSEDDSVCGCTTKRWTMIAEILDHPGHDFYFDIEKTVCAKAIEDKVTITNIGGSNE